jgi:tetratricopeptide (TPR) repeat protein
VKPAHQAWLAGAVIVSATLAVYHGIFSVPLLFDDFNGITLNPTIRHLWPPWEVLRTPQGTGSATEGRPLANLSLAINYAIGGSNPAGYHLFNLLVHVLAALTLFGVLRRMLAPRWATAALPLAFAAALLWAVHPLQTEAVTTIVERTELLVSLFYLLTLYGFIRGVESGASRAAANRWFVLAGVACFCGMASKEVMVSAPLLVLLYDRSFVAGSFREAWRRRRWVHLSLGGTWAVLVVLRLATPGRGATGGFNQGMSPWQYALTQCRAIVHYLRLSFWPNPLVLDYGTDLVQHLGAVLPQALFLLLLLGASALALRQKSAAGFAGICFFAILAPSSSFVPLTTQTAAEHRMYLPLAAVIAVVVCGVYAVLPAFRRKSRALPLGIALLAAAAGLGFTTLRRNQDYRSAVAIWTDTVNKMPNNPRPHDNLANALLETGRVQEAVNQYVAALRIDPNDAQAHYNLGGVLLDAGRVDEAIPELQAAVHDAPGFSWAHDNLGSAYARVGRFPEALEQYAEAVRADPSHAQARFNLGNMLVRAGRLNDAITQYQASIQLAPDLTAARYNLAATLAQTGRTAEAAAQYQIILQLHPDAADARAYLARLQGAP